MVTLHQLKRVATALVVLVGTVVNLSCSTEDPAPRGQLMIVLQTDMSLPKDVTNVRLLVADADTGSVRHDRTYKLAPDGDNPLPATLAVVDGDRNKRTAVQVSALGIRGKEVRIFTKTITTIPRDRLATLRVPIQWLCDGQVKELDDGVYDTSCDQEDGPATCVAGLCESAVVEEEELPDYEPADVFGGGEEPGDELGVCFPTEQCFDSGFNVVPDDDCRVEVAVPKGAQANFGLAVGPPPDSDGICGELGCYIPLDLSDLVGWSLVDEQKGEDGGTVLQAQLPPGICGEALQGRYVAVRATTMCETKKPSTPTCGPWSSIESAPPRLPLGEEVRGPVVADAGAPDAGNADAGVVPEAPPDAAVEMLPGPTGIEPAGGAPKVDINATLQLSVVVLPAADAGTDSGAMPLDVDVTWSSDDEEIAIVSDSGVVTGLSTGTVTITAEYAGVVQTIEVEVELGPAEEFVTSSLGSKHLRSLPTELVGSPADPCQKALVASQDPETGAVDVVQLPVGCQLTVQGKAKFVDGSSETITAKADWTTTDSAVATVSEDGKVLAVAEGTVEVVGEFDGKTLRLSVEVSAPALIAIYVRAVPDAPSAAGKNGAVQLAADGYYTDNDTPVDITELVEWGSLDESIVTIDDTGLAQGEAIGEAIIFAQLDGVRLESPFTVDVL